MARFSGGTFIPDPESIPQEALISTSKIDADKLQHIYKGGTDFDLQVTGTPTTQTKTVHVVSTAGNIRRFCALITETGTTTSVTFDLKKNGVSVLSAVITITNATTDGQVQVATLSNTTFVADDRFTITCTVTTATGAQGAFAWGEFEETAAV